MKKLLLAAFVVAAFAAYSYYQRHEDSTAVLSPSSKTSPQTSQTSASQQTSAGNSASSSPVPTPATTGQYKNGTYTGDVADAFYGNVQVRVAVQNGRIAAVSFLRFPDDNRTSQLINKQATPLLADEAVQAQEANVDTVSGATQTSRAFVESLSAALAHAV